MVQFTKEHQLSSRMFGLVESTLRQRCLQAGIGFVEKWTMPTSKQKYLLQMFTKDSVYPVTYYKNLNQHLLKNDQQLLICTDSIVEYENLSNIKFLCHRSLLGVKHFHVDPVCYNSLSKSRPSKLFNCFMHRIDSGRQSWFYFLYHHNLLDRGYVSFSLYQLDEYSELKDIELYDYIHNNFQLDKFPHFQEAYQQMRSKVPFKNFEENFNLDDKIIDSKYSLVLDTYALHDDWNSWYFSEKIARALMLPTCQLMFSQKGTLKKLSDLGIEIQKYNLDIDHLPWPERQQRLLEILCHDVEEYNFIKLKKIALHNKNQLQSFYQEIDQFYDQAIDLATSKFD